jgi:hypothetical protein
MSTLVWLPGLTSILALVFSVALFDQWRVRRQTFQLVWAFGMLFYGLASGCEAVGGAAGWSEPLYKTWYLTGALWTAGWLGLGTAFLLGRTRFGYSFAFGLFLAGLLTFLTQKKFEYPGAGNAPILYFIVAAILAVAVGVETYFQNDRWPRLAALVVVGATIGSAVLMVTTTLAAPGYALDPATHAPTGELFPGTIRLLTPFMNIVGAWSLIVGALFSAYVFMPKRRTLPYSLDPNQPGDQFLFNLCIAVVAIPVNFVVSLPGAIRALLAGRLHSRVPATILIAIGGIFASGGDFLNRFGITEYFQVGKFIAVLFLFAGFLVSIEVFREFRVPFTSIRLGRARHEPAGADALAAVVDDRADDGAAAGEPAAPEPATPEPASSVHPSGT